MMDEMRRIVLTGATGYIGGRLAPHLLEAGFAIRCLVRNPRKLQDRSWSSDPRVEIVQADLGKPDTLTEAMQGCHTAFYLVHSMIAAGRDYARRDIELAHGFAEA